MSSELIVDFRVSPDDLHSDARIREAIRNHATIALPEHFTYQIIRRNIDARQHQVWYVLRASIGEKNFNKSQHTESLIACSKDAAPVHIVGAGPCGYFAAIQLLKHGYKPIILERGKDVQARRRDLREIQQFGKVNPHSNYCFGEGGAGTYSDGKLYTRSDKRGNIRYVLEYLTEHGASPDILVDVHPHIGSNKLPGIVSALRKTITDCGGEVHFNQFVTGFEIKNQSICKIITASASIDCKKVILATGHSAREFYELFHQQKIAIEPKPFALGVRIEHPQALIDQLQYKMASRHENLPAASYSLSCEISNKGVFSFCMCPGGLIVPAATSPGEIVVNGMSLSRRDSAFANSGMVTSVDEDDFRPFQKDKELRGLRFQQSIERKVFEAGDGGQRAPAQRAVDFVNRTSSRDLPATSYIPGIFSHELRSLFPSKTIERLRDALLHFGKRLPGYLTNDAILVATESRTSAPLRIPRDPVRCEHIQVKGLYPAGEGAGYAGGILSAAMDGIRVADAIAKNE
ncbi:MAG: FAD-binding protein [Saprospiraceae bacterium]|nr:FAD-binding protein [Saprospiraceae bacterium]HMX89348.1 FAD-binding protein [Saprospiraceae bacterium]HMZ41313.1 FAD-binding protein [Saprospiraceae bacterium]HNC37599.1 FAD-binding protein [Saprospiraceae bacterium]HNE64028.1 FAD-binding protein [Saprospiraceae bacterium]